MRPRAFALTLAFRGWALHRLRDPALLLQRGCRRLHQLRGRPWQPAQLPLLALQRLHRATSSRSSPARGGSLEHWQEQGCEYFQTWRLRRATSLTSSIPPSRRSSLVSFVMVGCGAFILALHAQFGVELDTTSRSSRKLEKKKHVGWPWHCSLPGPFVFAWRLGSTSVWRIRKAVDYEILDPSETS